jgi:hypothetical protein
MLFTLMACLRFIVCYRIQRQVQLHMPWLRLTGMERIALRYTARHMQDRKVPSSTQIRFDPEKRQLMLVDRAGKPVSRDQRKAYISQMTLEELRALVMSLFELPIT